MKPMNNFEGRVSPEEVSVELSDEFLRLLSLGPFERDNGCPRLSHWLFLINER
jgi:hypothetical protein